MQLIASLAFVNYSALAKDTEGCGAHSSGWEPFPLNQNQQQIPFPEFNCLSAPLATSPPRLRQVQASKSGPGFAHTLSLEHLMRHHAGLNVSWWETQPCPPASLHPTEGCCPRPASSQAPAAPCPGVFYGTIADAAMCPLKLQLWGFPHSSQMGGKEGRDKRLCYWLAPAQAFAPSNAPGCKGVRAGRGLRNRCG